MATSKTIRTFLLMIGAPVVLGGAVVLVGWPPQSQ
jgi:hypothetical protein